jgi:hypothetical protein
MSKKLDVSTCRPPTKGASEQGDGSNFSMPTEFSMDAFSQLVDSVQALTKRCEALEEANNSLRSRVDRAEREGKSGTIPFPEGISQ